MSTAKLVFGLAGSIAMVLFGVVLWEPGAIALGIVMTGVCMATMRWLKTKGLFP